MRLHVEDVPSETTLPIEEVKRVIRFNFWADLFLVDFSFLSLKDALLNEEAPYCSVVKILNIVNEIHVDSFLACKTCLLLSSLFLFLPC